MKWCPVYIIHFSMPQQSHISHCENAGLTTHFEWCCYLAHAQWSVTMETRCIMQLGWLYFCCKKNFCLLVRERNLLMTWKICSKNKLQYTHVGFWGFWLLSTAKKVFPEMQFLIFHYDFLMSWWIFSFWFAESYPIYSDLNGEIFTITVPSTSSTGDIFCIYIDLSTFDNNNLNLPGLFDFRIEFSMSGAFEVDPLRRRALLEIIDNEGKH